MCQVSYFSIFCIGYLLVWHQSFATDAIKTPVSLQEALKDRNWVRALNEEIEALERNLTWEIVDS